jgi:hypothetical protein
MQTISFNTGRSYSAHGQRIAAGQLDDGRVIFMDIDRGLDYITRTPCELEPAAIMRAYDANDTTDVYMADISAKNLTAILLNLGAVAAKL